MLVELMTEEVIYQKSSQEITALLYEACLDRLDDAIEAIQNKEYVKANKHLQKSNDIIRRLGVGINYNAGIIADQLDRIYNYMADRLIEANLKKDITIIKEVQDILIDISSAWYKAIKEKPTTQKKQLRQKSMAYEEQIMTDEKLTRGHS